MASTDPLEAKEVTVFVDSDRIPAKVRDERLPDYVLHGIQTVGPAINWMLDPTTVKTSDSIKTLLTGEQYGWRLEDLVPLLKSLPLPAPSTAPVSINSEEDAFDLNTLLTDSPWFVKLDVGYWGAYHRKRERSDKPQRDFGIVDRLRVWLCRFNGSGAVAGTVAKMAHSPGAQALVKAIEARGCGVEIQGYAMASALAWPEYRELSVFLPDIHLPEKWPDRPPVSLHQAANRDAFDKLKKYLRNAQREPSTLTNNLSVSDQETIQRWIESIDAFPTMPSGSTPPSATVHTSSGPVTFDMDDIKAAKATVDRNIRIDSCWFYSEGSAGDGDASSAVDLVNFLSALQTLQPELNTQVYQVGDLYELWMNREFLYRDFPVVDSKAGSGFKLFLASNSGSLQDKPQYRMDEDWVDSTGKHHDSKRYVFHEWKTDPLLYRHHVGSDVEFASHSLKFPFPSSDNATTMLGDGTPQVKDRLAHARTLLRARVESVKAYSLPIPTGRTCNPKLIPASELASYHRLNAKGEDEYLWNKMILDKLAALSFKNIYGNHDGYRGDPLLKSALDPADQALPYISLKGLWCEHSHRWDNFNRDGMAFGAGITNMVYYYCKSMLMADSVKDMVRLPWWNEPQEQEAFIPGAALWFLLTAADISSGSRRLLPDVKLWGIYVSGHTHNPSIVKVKFDATTWAKFKAGVSTAAGSAAKSVESGAEDFQRQVGSILNPDPTQLFNAMSQ